MRTYQLLLVALLILPAVISFDATIEATNNNIFQNETARYTLTITNTNGFNDTFRVSTRDPSWIVDTNPNLGSIGSFTTKSYTLTIDPKSNVNNGPHAVPIKIRSVRTGNFKEENVLLNLKPRTPFGGEYAPAVDLVVDIPDTVDPRQTFPVTIRMDNQNPRDMPNLSVAVTSNFYNDSFVLPLPPLGEKTKRILVQPDRDQPPGIYEFRVSLTEENVTIAESRDDFEVSSYATITTSTDETTAFFQTTTIYRLTNEGNIREDVSKTLNIPIYNKLFASFSPQPERVQRDGTTVYQWTESLGPYDSLTIRVHYDYRLLALAIFLILISVGAYYLFRSPVVANKVAYVLEQGDDRKTMKVQIELRNRSKRKVKNVTVIDKIPNMADFVKREEPGTLTPDKVVTSSSKGTKLTYELNELEPYEERIIQYRIKSKLRVVGGLNLPSSKITYETRQGKERSAFSGNATVLGE